MGVDTQADGQSIYDVEILLGMFVRCLTEPGKGQFRVVGTGALILAAIATLLVNLVADSASEYPAIVASGLAFYIAQVIWPYARYRVDMPLCPVNVALLLFAMQLVVLPCLALFVGFQP